MRITPTRLNTSVAWLFVIGSSCFVLGSVPAYANAVGGWFDSITYALGSVFFTSASCCQLLQAQTPAMTEVQLARSGSREQVRWLAWLPRDRNWLAAASQFPGTLCFNVSTFAALIHNATVAQQDRLVWRPDLVGSVLFLVSSTFALLALPPHHDHRDHDHRERTGIASPRWIAWINMIGSIFFMASALGSYILPTGDLLSTRLTVAGTFFGAICFLVAAALMLPAWRHLLDATRPSAVPSTKGTSS